MQYTVGNNSIEYSILTKENKYPEDKYPEDLDLVFSVGECNKIVYIDGFSLNEGTAADAVAMLKEFCETFKENCIIFVLEPEDAKKNVLIRFILNEAGLCDMSKLIDDPNCTVFTYRSPYSYPLSQKFIDESISFDLTDMVNVQQDGRLDLLLKRMGKRVCIDLHQAIKEFYALDLNNLSTDSDDSEQPKKMLV